MERGIVLIVRVACTVPTARGHRRGRLRQTYTCRWAIAYKHLMECKLGPRVGHRVNPSMERRTELWLESCPAQTERPRRILLFYFVRTSPSIE